jgi:two-component system, LytTR family, response regulator
MMYRCIAIDDEPLALNVLADYIRQTTGLQLVDVTTQPAEGLARVQAGEADLVFLDIQMPGLTGIQFMKLAGNNCRFILTTAFAAFALEGYEYNVVDYLLKPFSYERFSKAIQKLPVVPEQTVPAKPDYLFIKSEYKLLRVDFSSMLFLESLRDYVAIHTADGKRILTLQPLSYFETELPAQQFARIHKSYIIALNKISYIEKNRVIINTFHLPVGDTYKPDFLKKIHS